MKPFMAPIKPDDELMITVTSLDPEATAPYNLPAVNPMTHDIITQNTSPQAQTYTVNSAGDIQFPVLGKIHVAGLDIEQIADLLESKISKTVEKPVVTVRMANFTVAVGGEVRIPQQIRVKRQRFSVLDALAEAGDMTEYGKRDNVLVVRENADGTKSYEHLDLTKTDVFSSPMFYLQPNDYVYVTPNAIKQANSRYNQNNAFKLSVISTIVSAASVVASLVIALTVK